MSWFALSLGAALTQAAQFAVVKGRASAPTDNECIDEGRVLDHDTNR